MGIGGEGRGEVVFDILCDGCRKSSGRGGHEDADGFFAVGTCLKGDPFWRVEFN